MKTIRLLLFIAIFMVTDSGSIFAQNAMDMTPAGTPTKQTQRGRKQLEDLNTPITGVTSDFQMRRNYELQLQKKSELTARIELLTSQLNTMKRSKVKKTQKEIAALQNELDITNRLLDSYPRSFIDPSINQQKGEEQSQELLRQMEQKAEEKLASVDLDAAAIDDVDDPEIRKAYQKYQKYGEMEDEVVKPSLSVYFSVQVASGRANQAHTIRGVGDDVQEIKLSNSSAYIVGQYATLAEAKRACNDIRANSRYKDAYVVAFSGNRRISTTEAQHLLGNR